MRNYISKIKRYIKYPFYKYFFGRYYRSDILESITHMTPKSIYLGKCVFIGFGARIQGISCYNKEKYSPKIIIGDGVTIQQNSHITCAKKITIGQNTNIAANVTITDINHRYQDIVTPVDKQGIDVSEVHVGEDCKIYNNVVVLPGVNIGRHCIIGANCVVNTDIPDYSVVVGVPCKVIKRYNIKRKVWERVR